MISLNSQLPASWSSKRLGDICSASRTIAPTDKRLRYLGLENIEPETGRILNWGRDDKTQAGISTTFSFNATHVLYGKLRPYLNKVALPESDGRCSTEIIPLAPSDGIQREFLAYLLRLDAITAAAMKGVTGARMPRANMRELLAVTVPVPPLREQQRIARTLREKFAELDRARRALADQLDAAEKLHAAHLRLVFHEHERRWPSFSLGELLSETRNGLYKPDSFYGRGVPIVKMYNIGRLNGCWDLSRLDRLELTAGEAELYALHKGDIVLNRVNSRELVGKCAVVDEATVGAVFESKNMRLRLDTDRADPYFVERFLNGYMGRSQIEGRIKQIAGMATLSRPDLDHFVIPLPSLVQQREIVAQQFDFLRQARMLRASLSDQLTALDRYPAALLRDAFAGRL
jgi:type I restriction enzyme S subunit